MKRKYNESKQVEQDRRRTKTDDKDAMRGIVKHLQSHEVAEESEIALSFSLLVPVQMKRDRSLESSIIGSRITRPAPRTPTSPCMAQDWGGGHLARHTRRARRH